MAEDKDVGRGPTAEQFRILAVKVEELEDRIRSLAVNDVDRLRVQVEENSASVRRLKSPRALLAAIWSRVKRSLTRRREVIPD